VILTTALLYTAGSRLATGGTARRRTILLGKYSLLGYIAADCDLAGTEEDFLVYLSTASAASLAALLLSVLLMVAIVEAVDIARQRSKIANDLYRLVFA